MYKAYTVFELQDKVELGVYSWHWGAMAHYTLQFGRCNLFGEGLDGAEWWLEYVSSEGPSHVTFAIWDVVIPRRGINTQTLALTFKIVQWRSATWMLEINCACIWHCSSYLGSDSVRMSPIATIRLAMPVLASFTASCCLFSLVHFTLKHVKYFVRDNVWNLFIKITTYSYRLFSTVLSKIHFSSLLLLNLQNNDNFELHLN